MMLGSFYLYYLSRRNDPVEENASIFRSRKIILTGCLLFLIGLSIPVFVMLKNSFFVIEPNERGVVISAIEPGGIRPETLDSGYHFVIPILERVERIETGRQTYAITNTGNDGDFLNDLLKIKTKDGQEIQLDISITYSIDPEQVVNLYKIGRNQYEESLIRPNSLSTVREVMTQYTFEETFAKRDEIGKVIFDKLSPVLAKNCLILLEVKILDIRRANQ